MIEKDEINQIAHELRDMLMDKRFRELLIENLETKKNIKEFKLMITDKMFWKIFKSILRKPKMEDMIGGGMT